MRHLTYWRRLASLPVRSYPVRGEPDADSDSESVANVGPQAAYSVASESTRPGKLVSKVFAFRSPDTLAFFEPKSFLPDLTHLAVRLGVNFKSRPFQTLDQPVRAYEAQARLTAYLVSLMSLRVTARELFVSEADELILDEVLLAVTGELWTQLSFGAAQARNLRRESQLSPPLGFSRGTYPRCWRGCPRRRNTSSEVSSLQSCNAS